MAPRPLTPERLDAGLHSASMLVAAVPFLFGSWARGFQKHVNELPLFSQEKSNNAGGDPNIRYCALLL